MKISIIFYCLNFVWWETTKIRIIIFEWRCGVFEPGTSQTRSERTRASEAAKSKLCSSRPTPFAFKISTHPLAVATGSQPCYFRCIGVSFENCKLFVVLCYLLLESRRWRSFAGIMFVMDPEALRFDWLVPCCGHVSIKPQVKLYNLQIQLESKGRWWLRTRMISGMLIIWFPLAIVSWLSLLGTLSSCFPCKGYAKSFVFFCLFFITIMYLSHT